MKNTMNERKEEEIKQWWNEGWNKQIIIDREWNKKEVTERLDNK